MPRDINEVKSIGRKMTVQEHDRSIMMKYKKSVGQKKSICLGLRDMVRDNLLEAWELDGEVYYAKVRN